MNHLKFTSSKTVCVSVLSGADRGLDTFNNVGSQWQVTTIPNGNKMTYISATYDFQSGMTLDLAIPKMRAYKCGGLELYLMQKTNCE